jgi:hypothetical protein
MKGGGYYTGSGEWVAKTVRGGTPGHSADWDALIGDAIERIQAKQTTARAEVRALLRNYPILKDDRENHPLLPLMGPFADETLA